MKSSGWGLVGFSLGHCGAPNLAAPSMAHPATGLSCPDTAALLRRHQQHRCHVVAQHRPQSPAPSSPGTEELLRWAGYDGLIRELTAQGIKSQLRSQSGDRDVWTQVLPLQSCEGSSGHGTVTFGCSGTCCPRATVTWDGRPHTELEGCKYPLALGSG